MISNFMRPSLVQKTWRQSRNINVTNQFRNKPLNHQTLSRCGKNGKLVCLVSWPNTELWHCPPRLFTHHSEERMRITRLVFYKVSGPPGPRRRRGLKCKCDDRHSTPGRQRGGDEEQFSRENIGKLCSSCAVTKEDRLLCEYFMKFPTTLTLERLSGTILRDSLPWTTILCLDTRTSELWRQTGDKKTSALVSSDQTLITCCLLWWMVHVCICPIGNE